MNISGLTAQDLSAKAKTLSDIEARIVWAKNAIAKAEKMLALDDLDAHNEAYHKQYVKWAWGREKWEASLGAQTMWLEALHKEEERRFDEWLLEQDRIWGLEE